MNASPPSRVVSGLLQSSAMYFLGSLFTSGAMFVNSIAVSWYLGKDGLGVFSLCLTAVLIGGLVADMGLNTIVLRDFAVQRQASMATLSSLLKVRAAVAVAISLVMLAAGVTLFDESPLLLVAVCLLVLPRSIAGVIENYLKARIQRNTYFAVTTITSLMQVLLVGTALSGGANLAETFFVLAGIEYGKSIVLLVLLRGSFSMEENRAATPTVSIRPLLIQGFPFAIIAILSLLSERADLFFLAALRGTEETGIYAGAERFLMLGNLFAFSFYGSALPVFSSLREKGDIRHIARRIIMIAGLLTAAVAGMLALGAPLIIATTFRFHESILLLRILSASLPGIVMNSILRIALFSVRSERPVATVLAAALIINSLLNVLLIPRYGALAAAMIAVGTEYAVMFGYYLLYVRHVGAPLWRLDRSC